MKETTIALEPKRKGKRDIIYCRMDETMINELLKLKESSGISVSEIIRESVRRLLEDAKMVGSVELSV